MTTVGLRELRQHASEIVHRAEEGETVTVTVSGRPAAYLVPAGRRTWRRCDEVRSLFTGQEDPDWASDREFVDQSLRDPWLAR